MVKCQELKLRELLSIYPELLRSIEDFECCAAGTNFPGRKRYSLFEWIMHLNDVHALTFVQIADKLDGFKK